MTGFKSSCELKKTTKLDSRLKGVKLGDIEGVSQRYYGMD